MATIEAKVVRAERIAPCGGCGATVASGLFAETANGRVRCLGCGGWPIFKAVVRIKSLKAAFGSLKEQA